MNCQACPEIKEGIRNIKESLIRLADGQSKQWEYIEDRTKKIQSNSSKIVYILGFAGGLSTVSVILLVLRFIRV